MKRETRTPISRPARIEFENGRTVSCRIANISSGGALLLVDNAEWLPNSFTLVDAIDGIKRRVLVMWAGPGKAGVKFEGSQGPVPRKPAGFGRRRG